MRKQTPRRPDPVIELVERANQRGGRILSVVDLIEAGTVSLELAAWMLERVEAGRSWLVGAKPGGAGKTTVMSAFLAMLPKGEKVWLTDNASPWREQSGAGNCLVAFEISPGPYHAYIWGEPVAKMLEIAQSGARVVTNLHADTLEQAREQVVKDNGVAPERFDLFETFLGIEVGRGLTGTSRIVRQVHFIEGGRWKKWGPATPLSPRAAAIQAFLTGLVEAGNNLAEDVRREWLAFHSTSGSHPSD